MTDDPTKTAQDRQRINAHQDYEIDYWTRRLGFLSIVVAAGCVPYAYDTPVTTDGTVTLKTFGDMGTATSRARLACGEPKRSPVLMGLSGAGEDQVATFGCQ